MVVVTEEMLVEMANTIAREIDPQAVILFGSRATGRASDQSDVDLLVVDSKPFDRERGRVDVSVLLWKALSRFPVPKDILVYSRDEIQKWRGFRNHIVAQALREGRVLYGSI